MKMKNAQPRNAELSARRNSANPTTTAPAAIVLTGQAQAVAGAVDHNAAYERIKIAMQSLQTLLQVKAEVAA